MNSASGVMGRRLLILILLGIAVLGTANLALRRRVSLNVARDGTRVVVSQVFSNSDAQRSGVSAGDVVVSIGKTPVRHLAEATWMIAWIPPKSAQSFTLMRGDSLYSVTLAALRPTPLAYILLDRLTALAFIVLGLLVWWRSPRDSTVAAFLRINLSVGVALLFNDFVSVFSTTTQALYAVAYVSIRSAVAAALIDFINRFTSRTASESRLRATAAILYSVAGVIAVASAVCVVSAHLTASHMWIERFDVMNRQVYSAWLLGAVAFAVTRLIYAMQTDNMSWRRTQNRWLLLCLLAGAAPYVLLERLPTMWGWSPLIPPDLATAILLITPVGWSMAVASFRMLRVEWTLSRTIVYLISAGIIIYLVFALTVVTSALVKIDLLAPVLVLIVIAVILVISVSRALVDRVQWAVDRVYYGDWFDYRRVARGLEVKLSNCLLEKDIVAVLTSEVSSVLKVEQSALIVRTSNAVDAEGDTEWHTAYASRDDDNRRSWNQLLPSATGSSEAQWLHSPGPLHKLGYSVAAALNHAGSITGWLLLGSKISGAPYSERDRRLLNSLSPVAGLALANMELNRRVLDHERRLAVIDLAGGIAHEIGNALSPLMGQAQLIESALQRDPEKVSRETVARSLEIIVDMSGRIRRIVQNLSRLSEPVSLQKTWINLNDVAEYAVQLMSETAGRIKRYTSAESDRAGSSPFHLKKEYESGLPEIMGDAQQLSQVYVNLILNAADAVEVVGHGVITVGTGESIDPPGVIGYVQDTGPGIESDLMNKIFLPYFTTKPRGKGTGLGLSTVNSIVEAHAGRVTVRSPAAGGSRFEFYLPL